LNLKFGLVGGRPLLATVAFVVRYKPVMLLDDSHKAEELGIANVTAWVAAFSFYLVGDCWCSGGGASVDFGKRFLV
jgi:hypothetical protein